MAGSRVIDPLEPILRCACGAALRSPPAATTAVRCPVCARVIRLARRTDETPLPIIEDAWPVDDAPPPGPAPSAPRPELLDLPDVASDEWPLDPRAPAPEDRDPWELPPTAEPGVAASLLVPMTRRRVDPILLWGSVAAVGLLLGVAAYVLGHAHGVSDAMAELGTPPLRVAPERPDPGATTPTERELFRLCRLLDETRPTFDDPLEETTAAGRRRLEEWLAPWRAGWQGPLGQAIRALDLKLDWVCVVAGYEPGRGFLCQSDGARFRLNAYGLGARYWMGQEAIRSGDRIELHGVRKALEAAEGVSLQLDARCEATVVIERGDLVRLVR